MENWTPHKLYDLAEWINGMAFRDINFSPNGLPVIKIAEIKNGLSGQTKFTDAEYDEKYLVTKGDMLFCWSGQPETSIGTYYWKDRDGWLNQHIFKVLPNTDIVNREFFYHLLQGVNPRFIQIARNKQTTGLGHVTKKDLQNIEVPIPPREEQKAIAKILSSLDDKIELNRRMNATLEAMARALFEAWFVDFEPVRANKENRPSTSASPEIAKLFPSDFENGIPKGWYDSTIGRITSIQNGYAFKSFDFKNEGYHGVIKIKNISGNQVDVLNTQFIDESIAKTVNERFKISSNDALIAMTGAEVGKVGLVPKINSNLWLNQRVGLIREKVPESKWFAYLVLSSEENRNQLLDVASGSAQPNISGAQIEKTASVIPPDSLVREYGKLVEPIFSRICENRFENQLIAEVRDSLLPRLISGKLKVGEESALYA